MQGIISYYCRPISDALTAYWLYSEDMLTLCQLLKKSVAEIELEKTFVITRKTTIIKISATEQVYFAPFCKDVIHAMQWSSYSCLHCTRSIFVALCFSVCYSESIDLKNSNL